MEKIQQFIQNFTFDKNVIFVWNPWVWKTHIMKALYKKIQNNKTALHKYWIDDGEFREKITSWLMFLRKEQDYACSITGFPLEMLVRSEVIFFDDLWASENISEAQKTKLKFILDQREKKWLITIFSTNLAPVEIEKLYWKRIKSRIYNWKHPKGLQIVTIPWEDKRRENIDQIQL